jgi:formylglycine-generating enzyme required for sulfatase activity
MAGLELDPQARDLAANVVKGVLTPEAAAAQAKVPVETINQWVATYIADAKASFEARAKSLLSQTKAGLLPQTGRQRQRGFSSTSAGVGMGLGTSPRAPLPAPTPFQTPPSSTPNPTPGNAATSNAAAAPLGGGPTNSPVLPPLAAPPPPRSRPRADAPVLESASAPAAAPKSAPTAAAPAAPAKQAASEAAAPELTATAAEADASQLATVLSNTPMPIAYPLPKPMAVGVSYSGQIEKDALLDAARSLATMQQSGILLVETSEDAGTIHFDSGEIIDAGYRGLRGQDAFWKLLDTSKGSFEVEGYSPPNERTIEAASTALLGEANRRRTIARHLKKHLGSSQQVLALVPLTREQFAGLGKIDTQLLALFDGKRSLKQVVNESNLDEFTALSQIQKLHDKGHLVPLSLRPVEVPAAPESLPAPRRSSIISDLPRELPFKRRHIGKWIGGGAVALTGVIAGAAFVAEGSLSPDAIARTFGMEDEASEASAAAFVAPVCTAAPAAVVETAVEAPKPTCPEGMVYIAPGHFTMGTNNQAPALAAANPAHDVEVTKGFCIDRAEVTVEAYNQCAGTTRCSQASSQAAWARDDRSEKAWEASLILHAKQCNAAAADRWSHPVNCVSWYQAKTYCEALGRRLPTEAEWEFTARGPSDRAFPWGDGAPKPQLLNACGKECRDWHETVGLSNEAGATLYEIADGFAATSPVGAFGLGATPEGVLDLAGNVFEWTLDGASEYSTTATDASKPSGERHMIRGGAYNSGNIESIDPTFRFAMPDATLSPAIGFRCASSP